MKDLTYFKNRLTELKNELTHRLDAIGTDIRHEGMSSDWQEQATERENDEVLQALGEAGTKELHMINAALQRIDSGEYTSCQNCGEDIPQNRHELLPFTTLCIHCAESLERK